MGHGTWSERSYDSYATSVKEAPRHELFHRSSATAKVRSGQQVNVESIGFREARDSADHPITTPVIVGFDVSGSMGMIPEYFVKEGLGKFVGQLLQRQSVPGPQMMFLAIGDAVTYDRQPLQATQFESDNRICDQLTDLYLEGAGGGNDFESYDLAWAFAAHKTKTDAWDKRKAKGYVFTVGDECFPGLSSSDYLRRSLGGTGQSTTPDALLADCQERYHTFHVIIAEGQYCLRHGSRAPESWERKLGKRAVILRDYRCLDALLVSIIAVDSGEPLEDVLGWWNQSVAKVLSSSLQGE